MKPTQTNVAKLSDSKIEVTKTVTPEPVTVNYDYDFLISQKASIIKQANDFLALRQAELDEVQGYLDQCDQLGVTFPVMPSPLEDSKPIQPVDKIV